MKTRTMLFALAVAAAIPVPGRAGLPEGVDAYRRGDHAGALAEWQPLAERGNAEAQFFLGYLYQTGHGVPTNFTESARWFGKAAERGNWQAQFGLALLQSTGLGVRLDVVKGRQRLLESAEQGHPVFKTLLAAFYATGQVGIARNRKEAAHWLQRAADEGEPIAETVLGLIRLIGPAQTRELGLSRDTAAAERWLARAADQGVSAAQLVLAGLYEKGDGIPKDAVAAYKWASLGFDGLARDVAFMLRVAGPAVRRLAESTGEGLVPKEGLETFVDRWVEAFAEGFALGLPAAFEKNKGTAKERAKAFADRFMKGFREKQAQDKEPEQALMEAFADAATELIEAQKRQALDALGREMRPVDVARAQDMARRWRPVAAVAATPIAMPFGTFRGFQYGEMIEKASLSSRDAADAWTVFFEARAGTPKAQYQLGDMYANGDKFAEDDGEATRWYRKAADKGHAPAMHALGLMYADGRGVRKNLEEAARWHHRAALKGLARAQIAIARAFAEGQGVRSDAENAATWYRRAAESGDGEGQLYLGLSYAEGAGVPRDPVLAYKWLHLAAAAASDEVREKARKARDDLQARMDRGRVKEARDLAEEWRPRAPTEAQPESETARVPGPKARKKP